MPPSWAR